MKKSYEVPEVLFEEYQLNMSIASNCSIVVSNGPAMGNHTLCDDYEDPFSTQNSTQGLRMAPRKYNVFFYGDTHCDCYESASSSGYWTS